ncbi:MAG: hypothetical protein K0S34_1861 [Bacillales bacterium]|jgi:uncharacterized protein YbjQ (UPF0145 family)|nr:hypothetical protein [Bacillales bacterium]
MLLSTTPNLEGYVIEEYLGVVSEEAIIATNVVRDIMAGVRDFVGGRSKAYEEKMENARQLAIEDLKAAANKMGANAIIGVNFDHEAVGAKGSLLMCVATGTAVKVSKK